MLISTKLRCVNCETRGVNAGGWPLLEPWITPYLFQEVNYGEHMDKYRLMHCRSAISALPSPG